VLRLALRSTLAKKRRLVGTALSVVLGIAFLSGTLVFTDTIRSTFDDLFASIYRDTDAYVRSSSKVDLGQAGTQRGRIPESLVAKVAAVDGVADAKGIVSGYAQIVGADGKVLGNPGTGAPTFAMSYASPALTPWKLVHGSRPPGPNELVVDKASYDKGHLKVGEQVTIITQSGPHRFPLVGVARFGSVDSPGGATAAVLDLATAQDVLVGGRHQVDAILVDADPGVGQRQLADRIAGTLPKGVEALTGDQIVKENQDLLHEGLSFFDTFLLVFAAIGLVVACFTIYNTFQIIVSQRTREMALLRALGASRRQVVTAQLLEAVIVGLVASIVGLVAGFGVATLLKGMLEAVGIDIPAGATVFRSRTALAALGVGTAVTVGAAVLPSLRASRVPPLAAIRDLGAADDAGGQAARRRLVVGGLPLAAGIAAFVAGLAGRGIAWVGVGALLAFLGTFALGPLLARPVAGALGWPVARLVGVTGRLARQNATRNASRTARTGGALMVGVALVAAITIIAATAKDWTRDVFAEQFTGDAVVSTRTVGLGGLSPEVARRLNALPEVAAAAGIRMGSAHDLDHGGDTTYVAIDPATAGKVFDLDVAAGSIEGLDARGVLIDEGVARSRHLRLGSVVRLGFIDGKARRLRVEGIYRRDDLAGRFVISQALHQQTGVDQFDFSVFVEYAPGVGEARALAALASVTDRYPNADLQSRSEYIDAQAGQVDQIVNLMYGLLGLAVVIALFSIANSVSLSIHERTRELGLLRAVGMTRRQVGSTVRWEAGIIATFGVALGVVLGVFFGWAISVALRDDGLLAVAVPVPALAVVAVAAVVGGVLAAIRPAWRAAHLDVLQAIASE
jgi:putative ABC transport system permease protein